LGDSVAAQIDDVHAELNAGGEHGW
jgi:hypothetical protein